MREKGSSSENTAQIAADKSLTQHEEKAQSAKDTGAGYPSSAADSKTAAQERFMAVFQDLLKKGLGQSEAAAKALEIVSCK